MVTRGCVGRGLVVGVLLTACGGATPGNGGGAGTSTGPGGTSIETAPGDAGAPASTGFSDGTNGANGTVASTTGAPTVSGDAATSGVGESTAATSGEPGSQESCPPELSDAAQPWKDAYDVHFEDTSRMRSSLELFPGGSGHWGQSYTLRSLVLAYELSGELDYLHELMWQAQALEELLSDTDSWPTGVCGNSFVHETVVIDARLLAPLLRAAWWMQHSRLADDAVPDVDGRSFDGATYADVAASYAVLAETVLAGHESELRIVDAESFGPHEGSASAYYRFPASYTCVASEVMPFNYANSAGTAYAELWRLTGDAEARERAEQLLTFWWNRTYSYQPAPSSARSRWWGYRGLLDEAFDPSSDDRPEDGGHADMSSTFAARAFALGLQPMNGTRMDQIALASKRWIDRAVGAGDDPAELITNADTEGDWRDLFDHLPMACHRSSIYASLVELAPEEIGDGAGGFARSTIENIAELAYYAEFTSAGTSCGPRCGDGICQGPEDAVGCPEDCSPVVGACP